MKCILKLKSISISHTKTMLVVKLDYGFCHNLYMDFYISAMDFDI